MTKIDEMGQTVPTLTLDPFGGEQPKAETAVVEEEK